MKTIRNFWKRQFAKLIEAREHRAAEDMARFLIRNNDDFRGCSEIDLVRAIQSKETVRIGDISQ